MPEPRGILAGNIGGNRDVSSQSRAPATLRIRLRGKRQHIGRLVLLAELTVQAAYGGAAGDQNIYRGAQSGVFSCTQDKTFKRAYAKSRHFLLQTNQVILWPRLPIGNELRKEIGKLESKPSCCVLDYPLAAASGPSRAASLAAAAAACFSALAASACRGSASSSICCSATLVLCSS